MKKTTHAALEKKSTSARIRRKVPMLVVRHGRKYGIEGVTEGWVTTRLFPRKWKAEIALEVFREGGTFRNYCAKMNEALSERPVPEATRAIAENEKACQEICALDVFVNDIRDFAEIAGYGAVTTTKGNNFFGPSIHDTWGAKLGGRVHIDLGACGIHLMLDRHNARRFIDFLKERRQRKNIGI